MARQSIEPVYERLKDQYDLVLTNTFALENGYEDFREDFEILCGESAAGKFQVWHDGGLFIFDVEKADGTYTHWHPSGTEEIVKSIREFMAGKSDSSFNESNTLTHHMKLNPSPFEKIKSGEKTIELRLWDEKRQKIQPGDSIVFTNTETGETLTATVIKLHRFDRFHELYKALPLLKCGYTAEDVQSADPADMESYYSKEEQAQYGVVGIEICI